MQEPKSCIDQGHLLQTLFQDCLLGLFKHLGINLLDEHTNMKNRKCGSRQLLISFAPLLQMQLKVIYNILAIRPHLTENLYNF